MKELEARLREKAGVPSVSEERAHHVDAIIGAVEAAAGPGALGQAS